MKAEDQLAYLRGLVGRPRMSLARAIALLQREIMAEALRQPPPTIEQSIAKIRAIADRAGLEVMQIRDARNGVAAGWMSEWEARQDDKRVFGSAYGVDIKVNMNAGPPAPPRR